MSSNRIKEIRKRLEAATPGPWGLVRCDAECGDIDWQAQQEQRPFQVITTILEVLNGRARQDATVIANAPDDIRHLLEAVATLKGHADALLTAQRALYQCDRAGPDAEWCGADRVVQCEACEHGTCAGHLYRAEYPKE
jgi:hypothetical protein